VGVIIACTASCPGIPPILDGLSATLTLGLYQGCPFPRGTCFEKGLTGPEALTQAIRLRGIISKDGNEARCPKNAGDGPLFARSIYEVAAHRQGSHNQEIPRCGCGIKQDSEPPVSCRRSHNHSVSEIQRE